MRGFRIQWQRPSDRFLHRIVWHTDALQVVLLHAVDDQDGATPPRTDGVGKPPAGVEVQSPPLQQVERPTDDLALGVGMSGKNHWSVSVESTPARIEFDLACRVHEPVNLGMVYALPPQDVACHQTSEGLRLTLRETTEQFALVAPGLTWHTVGPWAILQLPPPSSTDRPSVPTTIRWKYSLERIAP